MAAKSSIAHFVKEYGDLLFDLCQSLLRNQTNSEIAFRSIIKAIQSKGRFQRYKIHEQGWVLSIAYEKLKDLYQQQLAHHPVNEGIILSATENSTTRFKNFNSYFHRLLIEDQFILLLKDKFNIPYSDISTAMEIPSGSLKTRRQQALRTLEEWLWTSE